MSLRRYKYNTFNDFIREKGGKQLLYECKRIESAVFEGVSIPDVARDFDVAPPVIFEALVYIDAIDKSMILEEINRKDDDEHK